MLVPEPDQLAKTIPFRLEYESGYVDGNQIGDEGCEHLSKTTWKNLSFLDLGKNKIGPDGCEHLSQATSFVESLSSLDLSIHVKK